MCLAPGCLTHHHGYLCSTENTHTRWSPTVPEFNIWHRQASMSLIWRWYMGDCKEHSTCIPQHIPSILYGLDRMKFSVGWNDNVIETLTQIIWGTLTVSNHGMCTPCWWTKSCNSLPSHKTTVISRKYILWFILSRQYHINWCRIVSINSMGP